MELSDILEGKNTKIKKAKEFGKKAIATASALTNILVWSAIGAESFILGKNFYEHDSQANIENRLTKSDLKQMRHLTRPLDKPIPDFSDYKILEGLNEKETIQLSLAFLSYSLTNIALNDPSQKEFAGKYIDIAIQKAMTPEIKGQFDSMFGDPFKKDKEIKDNVLYLGHLNLMMGAYQLVTGDKKYFDFQKRITDGLSEGFINSPTHHLESYNGNKWPADNTVALASLDLFDKLNKENHSKAIKLWKEWTLKNMIDKDGLLYSHIDPITQKQDEEARGCSMSYSLIFINMFDPQFSKEMYSNYRKTFFKKLAGVDFAREWLADNGKADVDSGPIIRDVGSVASAFAIGASKLHGDYNTFNDLSMAAEIATIPYETLSEKGYMLNVSLGESVLLFGRTLKPWTR